MKNKQHLQCLIYIIPIGNWTIFAYAMHVKNEKQKSILDATFSHELIKSLKMSFTTIKFHDKYTVRITKWRGEKKK